jgi:hypothetical protein
VKETTKTLPLKPPILVEDLVQPVVSTNETRFRFKGRFE